MAGETVHSRSRSKPVPEGNGDDDDREKRSGVRRMERRMGALSPADPRLGGPRDVRLQHAGSRPTPDVPRSDCRAQRACVEFVARPGNRPGDSLPANRERRPRGASHSPEWTLSAPSIVPTRASGSQSTSRDASSSRFRISPANLRSHPRGDGRAQAFATVPSNEVASKRWLPVSDRESREHLGWGFSPRPSPPRTPGTDSDRRGVEVRRFRNAFGGTFGLRLRSAGHAAKIPCFQ